MGVRVIPYTDLSPATRAAVPDAIFVEMTNADSYRLLLKQLWERGVPFTLIEHDVAPAPGQIEQLEACSKPWCHFGYCPGDWVPTFGCVRFSAELIAGTQGIWDDELWPWCQLDAKFAVAARGLGWKHHWHYPHVLHTRFAVNRGGVERRERLSDELELAVLSAEMDSLASALGSRR